MSLLGPTARTEALLEELVDRLSKKATDNGLSADQLKAILESVSHSSAEAMRTSLKPENPDHPHISAYFNKEDAAKYGGWENKPTLRVKTFFCGIEENEDRLTPAEIEGYNAITERKSARGGKWKAEIKHKGEPHEELHIQVPMESVDQRMDLPPLVLLLHELNGGPSTADLHQLLKQIDHLKALAFNKGITTQEMEAALLA